MAAMDDREHRSELEYDHFVNRAYDYLYRVQDGLKKQYRISEYERYDWDQERGVLEFSNAGEVIVTADFQFVGSIATKKETWLWSWDNPSILEAVKRLMTEVRQFGETHDFRQLTEACWPATEEDGWAMTAVTAYILQAKGAYRSPSENGYSFVVLMTVKWASNHCD